MGVAELDQARALGVLGNVAFEADRPHLVCVPARWAHDISPDFNVAAFYRRAPPDAKKKRFIPTIAPRVMPMPPGAGCLFRVEAQIPIFSLGSAACGL
jgi:hypothetical protein